MTLARHAPRARSTVLRMAIANIHRPGALTPTIVLSLGLGIALLVTVIEIDGNLRQQFSNELPAKAPSFYFLDIPSDQADTLRRFRARAGAAARSWKKCRCCAGASSPPTASARKNIKPTQDAAWVLQSDRGITYSRRRPGTARGWSKANGGPAITTARRWSRSRRRIADGLGLKLGDPVMVNVLGRNITRHASPICARSTGRASASISSWCFRRNAFGGAPHTHLATLTYPDGGTPAQEGAMIRAVADSFPMVTTVRVKDALDGDRRPDRQSGARRFAAPARSRCWRRRWCWAARSPPAIATGSMTR